MDHEEFESTVVQWRHGFRNLPVWRDGRCSIMSYTVIATTKRELNEGQRYVCVRKLGSDGFKIKFYPSAETWEIDNGLLGKLGLPWGIYCRADYQGTTGDRSGLMNLLAYLQSTRKYVVMSPEMLMEALDTDLGKYDKDTRVHTPPKPVRQKSAAKPAPKAPAKKPRVKKDKPNPRFTGPK